MNMARYQIHMDIFSFKKNIANIQRNKPFYN